MTSGIWTALATVIVLGLTLLGYATTPNEVGLIAAWLGQAAQVVAEVIALGSALWTGWKFIQAHKAAVAAQARLAVLERAQSRVR